MWSSEGQAGEGARRVRVRRRALLSALLAGGLALSGCGFRPLYGENSAASGGSTVEHLAAIQIVPLQDRPGQMLHNMLRDRLNPQGQPSRYRYRLEVDLVESIRELGLRSDETATRADLSLIADYTLFDPSSESVIFRGSSRTINGYNIRSSQYATYTAEQDARERGMRVLSEDIRSRLAVFFARAPEPE